MLVEIWNGKDHFGPLTTGSFNKHSLRASKIFWHSSSQTNHTFFESNANRGYASLVIFLIKIH